MAPGDRQLLFQTKVEVLMAIGAGVICEIVKNIK